MTGNGGNDAEAKWVALQRAAEEFRAANGRYPTFWLDKVCIDQNNIGDGLRALPVSVMAYLSEVLPRMRKFSQVA